MPSLRHTVKTFIERSRITRNLLYDSLDLRDRMIGRVDALTPPRKLVHGIGAGLEIGRTFLEYFKQLGQLQPHESVLDVGCGVGRMAIPLTNYLNTDGKYEGFDIIRENIAWCQRAITPRFPNFTFQHLDLINKQYNPQGILNPATTPFPYPDESFDFVTLTSVFTHLLPNVSQHYLNEIARVMKPSGRCLATFFILNDEALRCIESGKSKIPMSPWDSCYVSNLDDPEECIAFYEQDVLNWIEAASLTMRDIHRGSWCSRETFFDYQDIVMWKK